MYRQRPPYGGLDRGRIEGIRGRIPPRGRIDPRRPPHPQRGPEGGEEPPHSMMERILSPGISSRITVYSGVVSLSIAILNILVNILPFSWIISCCLSPVYLIGWLSMITAVVFAIIVLVKGDEDQHNSAYLGMGLAVGSIILLVAGGILFSVFGLF